MLIGKPYLPPLESLLPTSSSFTNVQAWPLTKQEGNKPFKEVEEKILEFSFIMDEDSPVELKCKKSHTEEGKFILNFSISEQELLKCIEEMVEWKY